jgi:hypothetical protein
MLLLLLLLLVLPAAPIKPVTIHQAIRTLGRLTFSGSAGGAEGAGETESEGAESKAAETPDIEVAGKEGAEGGESTFSLPPSCQSFL